MKIGEVKVGEVYGALDSPSGRYGSRTPREVKALEIVTVEEQFWAGAGFSAQKSTRNVRRVKVEVLDENAKDGWGYDKIQKAQKGEKLVIEARQLVALWKEIRPGLLAQIKHEQEKAARQADIEHRLTALGFDDLSWGAVEVRVSNSGAVVSFRDEHLNKLLNRLEAS